jgi:hypothetical protein
VGGLEHGGRQRPEYDASQSATQSAARPRRETEVTELGMHIGRPGHGSHLVTPSPSHLCDEYNTSTINPFLTARVEVETSGAALFGYRRIRFS